MAATPQRSAPIRVASGGRVEGVENGAPSPEGSGASAVRPSHKRRRTWPYVAGAFVVAGLAVAMFLLLRDGTSARDITLVVADKTQENKLPADMRIVVSSSPVWFPTW